MNPHLRWAAALAAITMLTSCSVDDGFPDEMVEGVPGSSVATPAFTGAPRLELPASAVSTVATGFRIPWGLAFLPDGTALVTERGNKVPDAPDDPGGTARIMSVTPQGVVTEVQRLPEVDLRLGEGGRLAFGPDGMLYASVGETYFGSEIAQDRNSLGGKILRMTLDGKPAPDNPVPGSLVWSYGHRNVQGLALGRAGPHVRLRVGLQDLRRTEPDRARPQLRLAAGRRLQHQP